MVVDVIITCGTRGARAVGAASACGNALGAARRKPPLHACACAAVPRGWGGAPLHALWRLSQVRVALVLSAEASSLAPSSPILLAAARGAHARWARRARAAMRSGRRAARTPLHACARAAVPRGWAEGAGARTCEVQLGAALADLLQRLSEPHLNHFSRPLELARSTATLLCCSRTLPAQRNREGGAQASTP